MGYSCGCIEKREPASGWDIDYVGDVEVLTELGFDAVKFDGYVSSLVELLKL